MGVFPAALNGALDLRHFAPPDFARQHMGEKGDALFVEHEPVRRAADLQREDDGAQRADGTDGPNAGRRRRRTKGNAHAAFPLDTAASSASCAAAGVSPATTTPLARPPCN